LVQPCFFIVIILWLDEDAFESCTAISLRLNARNAESELPSSQPRTPHAIVDPSCNSVWHLGKCQRISGLPLSSYGPLLIRRLCDCASAKVRTNKSVVYTQIATGRAGPGFNYVSACRRISACPRRSSRGTYRTMAIGRLPAVSLSDGSRARIWKWTPTVLGENEVTWA
jgi:hypothetical protein